jgi:hypothetical protein
MTNEEVNKLGSVISASFAKAIAPVVARLKAAEEQLREAGAINRGLSERVAALEAQQK